MWLPWTKGGGHCVDTRFSSVGKTDPILFAALPATLREQLNLRLHLWAPLLLRMMSLSKGPFWPIHTLKGKFTSPKGAPASPINIPSSESASGAPPAAASDARAVYRECAAWPSDAEREQH